MEARIFAGNPYDGHTLHEQIEQASILMQATGVRLETAYVDLGYRGGDQDNPGIEIKHRGKFKSLTAEERTLLKRRQAIEPIIGHFKGAEGGSLYAVLCAAGYNIRWLLRMIIKKISTFFTPVSGWRPGGIGCAGVCCYVYAALEIVLGSQAPTIADSIGLVISRSGSGLNFSGTTE